MKTLTKQELQNLAMNHRISYHEILLLLSHVMNVEYSRLFFEKSYDISEDDYKNLHRFLSRRNEGEPIAKILETKEFYAFSFKTTKDTLDPRPETELLIDLFKRYHLDNSQSLQILDLGAGTGCIGITLLKFFPNAVCCFSDISEKALSVAQENATRHQVLNRSEFVQSDWFENINKKFDAIISNPPYVATSYELDRETLYDPEIALFAGNDGMDAYRNILPNASKYLKLDGLLFLEIGYDQSEKIKQIPSELKLIRIEHDLAGIKRACIFRFF